MTLAFTLLVSFQGFFIAPVITFTDHPDPKTNIVCRSTGEMAWKTEYEDNQVRIESGMIVYTGQNNAITHERIVFRYTNRTSKNMQLSFGRKMTYDGVCYGCDNSDKRFLVDLKPGETKEYSEQNKDKTYYIFSKDLKQTIKKSLNSFELTNIETLVQ